MEKPKIYTIESPNGSIHVEVSEDMKVIKDTTSGRKSEREYIADDGDSKLTKKLKKAVVTFDEVSTEIKNVANNIYGSIKEMDFSPDELEVEFGIKLGGEAGVVIAKTTIEANFQVKLKWAKEGSSPS